eukprot:7920854-Karenia_brevis.AAC.1
MWPKPLSYIEELKSAINVQSNPFIEKWDEWIAASNLVPFTGNGQPSSRKEIHEAFAQVYGEVNIASH